ncbi:MAG: hypothetical protein AAF743_07040, partial [Planctomycetota bacterium]
PEGTQRSSISLGQTSTIVNVGPQTPSTFNTQFTDDGAAFASTAIGVNKVLVDSRVLTSNFDVAYAGSYWGDVITFTNGVGPLTVSLTYDLDVVTNDEGGGFQFGDIDDIENPTFMGRSAVRHRTFVEGLFGQPAENPDPSLDGPDFFLRAATDSEFSQFGGPAFDLPVFDPLDPETEFDDGFGDFFFFEDENGEEVGLGPVTTANEDFFTGASVGIRFEAQFGQPIAIGQLLEAWAVSGAVVDASQTATFGTIEISAPATLESAGGFQYSLVVVPEPSVGLLALGGLALRRRR